jgi:hypothetical protein
MTCLLRLIWLLTHFDKQKTQFVPRSKHSVSIVTAQALYV